MNEWSFGSSKHTALSVAVAADHGGFELKRSLIEQMRQKGYRILDFGARVADPADDYPDFVTPLARAVARGAAERGVALCGSGVGVCVAANKVVGARACLVQDAATARQGVEDDDLNVLCLSGRLPGPQAWEVVEAFLAARFSKAERHIRRVAKVMRLEAAQPNRPLGEPLPLLR